MAELCNIVAEQNVLGGLMLEPGCLASVCSFLACDDFFQKQHRLIYQAIIDLSTAGKPYDPVTMADWISSNGFSELVAPEYVTQVANETGSSANVVAYAEIVAEKARLRKIQDLASELLGACQSTPLRNSREIAATAAAKILEVGGSTVASTARSMAEIGGTWYAELSKRSDQRGMSGLGTPWTKFNEITDGLQDSDLIVLAGRPSMGKSAVAMNMTLAVALRQFPAMYFSLEMKAEALYSIATSIISTEVPRKWIRRPDNRDTFRFEAVTGVMRALNHAPLIVDDASGLSMDQIVLRAKREHMRKPLRLVVIDHAHIIAIPGKTKESTEIGDISRKAKGLAKSLNCPVVLLAQLNRSVEQRANKRPNMSDLRESGAIEQDADLIVFLYRDDYYAEKEGRASMYPGFIEMDIAKQREGELGRVFGQWVGAHGRIDDVEHDPIAVVKEKEPSQYRRKPRSPQ